MRIVGSEKQVKMGQRCLKKGISKEGWWKHQQTPRVKDMVIRLGKPETFSKKPMGM